MTPDREEALRLTRAKIVNALNLTPLVPPQADAATMNVVEDAWGALHDYSNIFYDLAADLEAAERKTEDVKLALGMKAKLWSERAEAAERDLATAREALERALPAIEQGERALIELGWTMRDVTAAVAVRAALRSLDGEGT